VHAFVAVDDVAAYAVAATTHPAAANAVLTIGGPEPVSWREIVACFEAELDREVPIHWVDAGEPIPGLPPAVYPLMWSFEAYDSPLDTRELAATFGVEQRTLADFVRGFVAASS
jgi:uncharacterized protein YbjT (DUF2867 family)